MKNIKPAVLKQLNHKTDTDIDFYIDQVINRKIIVGNSEYNAVKRYLKDLENPKWNFEKNKAYKVINFVQIHCRHFEGVLAGKRLRLEPFQKFLIWNIYGFIEKETGYRRFKKAWVQISRKNGKTLLCAALAIYHLIEDGEASGQIYSISSKLAQSKIVFDAAAKIIEADEYLSSLIVLAQYKIKSSDSYFSALASTGRKSDGYNPSFVIVDEAHTMDDNGEMYNAMYSGMGSRVQPLIFSITTAGLDLNCWAYDEFEMTEKILSGEAVDDSYFIMNFIMEKKDDWTKIENWRKSNPNLGISVRQSFLEQRLAEAIASPTKVVDFLTKNLNQWTNAAKSSWLSYDNWNKAVVKPMTMPKFHCYAGLDLSSSIDLTAFAMTFVSEDGTICYNRTHCFLPEDNVQEAEKRDKMPYQQLQKAGLITLTSGNVIDFEEVSEWIQNAVKEYNIEYIACDRWKLTDLVHYMPDLDYKFIEFSQGYKTMSPAIQHFERGIMETSLRIEENPIMNNHINNCSVKMDDNGNVKIVKVKRESGKHIDGVIASIMSYQIALDQMKFSKREVEDDVMFF
jgi:phage terminase large subunit-like protein